MKYCNISLEDYQRLLQFDNTTLEGIIRDYIIHLKVERKLSSNNVNVYMAAVTHFNQMNDIVLNWKKLSKFKGKKRLVVNDNPHTKEHIRQMLIYDRSVLSY